MELNIRIDHFHHFPNGETGLMAKLGSMDAKLTAIEEEFKTMTPQLQALTDEVTKANTVSASAVALIKGLAGQIEANKTDPVALQALADSLKTSDTALSDAVTANTPATTTPPGTTPPTGANPI